jgi:sugar transferase (PEP-CTERM/EpsH1 system associated)
LAWSPQELEKAEALRDYCAAVDVVLIRPRWSKIKSLLHLFSSKPLTLQYFYSKHLQQLIHQRIIEEEFDAIIVFSSCMAQFLPPGHTGFKIIDFTDVDSDKWLQYAEHVKSPLSIIYRLESKKLKKLASLYDCCTVISEAEERLFRSYSKRFVLCTVPNGVDLDYFQVKTEVPDEPTLIFMGVMDYYANVDGVLYFHDQILPHIRRVIPNVKFIILGGNPTRAIRRLGRSKNVSITGYVKDVRSFLSQATACVVPLRIARGVQNKVLEAMAIGLPVVATSRAVEGIDAHPGRNIIVADDPMEFAAKTVELLSDGRLQRRISQNARQLVEDKYEWDHCLRKLDLILETIPSRSPAVTTSFIPTP